MALNEKIHFVFSVLQGSVETLFKSGGKINHLLIA